MRSSISFIVCAFCLFLISFADDDSLGTPHHAFWVFRHGARTPAGTQPHDAAQPIVCGAKHSYLYSSGNADALVFDLVYDDPPTFPGAGCGTGTLSETGWRQHIEQGRATRVRLIDELGLLPTNFSPDAAAFRSTLKERTLESLEAHLQGIWPELAAGGAAVGTVVPVSTSEGPIDMIKADTLPSGLCKRHDLASERVFDAVNAREERSAPLREACKWLSGAPCSIQFWGSYEKAWDSVSMRNHNHWVPVPDGAGSHAYVGAADVAMDEFAREMYRTEDFMRGTFGHTLTFLAAELRRVISGDRQGPAVNFWSAHDTTVAPLVAALRTEGSIGWPHLAGVVELLVRRRGADDFTLSGRLYGEPMRLLPQGCTECAMDDVLEYIDSIAVAPGADFEQWCSEDLSLGFVGTNRTGTWW